MRPLLPLAALLALATPAEAQVRLGVLANAGYGAPSVGAGAEAGWTPPGAPVRLGVRVSGDYVVADGLPYAVISVAWRFVYVEGTYGGGDASRERIAVGVAF